MTAFNPSSGRALGLPDANSRPGASDAAALAEPSPLFAPAQSAADASDGLPGDTPLLHLLRQLLGELARIGNSDGQLSDREVSAVLACIHDLARRIADAPATCPQKRLARLLALHRVAAVTL